MQHNYVTMQNNYVNMRLKSCLHVYISNYPACLHNEVHINISMLHLDNIYLACKGQNYTIIDHSSCTDCFFSNIQLSKPAECYRRVDVQYTQTGIRKEWRLMCQYIHVSTEVIG